MEARMSIFGGIVVGAPLILELAFTGTMNLLHDFSRLVRV
jgi:hypothetical protein